MNTVHPFEKSGLGLAPFRCVGFDVRKYQACPDAPVQPGASCDFCGTGIMNVFTIQSADGKRFIVGCDCVAKTGDHVLRSEVVALRKTVVREARQVAYREAEQARKTARVSAMASAREEILAGNADLAAAFMVRHPIIDDISERLTRTGTISDAQRALVLKIAAEVNAPPEKHVKAPKGRVSFEGTIVSKKSYEGPYGSTVKMVVKIETDAGSWLAFGTVPAGVWDDVEQHGTRLGRGSVVQIKATLEPGRDEHFAFMKRPNGRLLFAALETE